RTHRTLQPRPVGGGSFGWPAGWLRSRLLAASVGHPDANPLRVDRQPAAAEPAGADPGGGIRVQGRQSASADRPDKGPARPRWRCPDLVGGHRRHCVTSPRTPQRMPEIMNTLIEKTAARNFNVPIVVVEDEDTVLSFLEKSLRSSGYRNVHSC